MLELFAAAAYKVLLAGLILGAGLPLVFALGVRFAAAGSAGVSSAGGGTAVAGKPGYRVLSVVCFAVVAAAVVLGLLVIVSAGFGKMVSFEHVYPTIVPKA